MRIIHRVSLAAMFCTAAMMLMACNIVANDGVHFDEESESLLLDSEQGIEGGPTTEAAKDCFVSITCANGTTRSCSGTLGQCSASGSGNGSVSCNGSAPISCPSSSCDQQGLCNPAGCPFDPFDPDCGCRDRSVCSNGTCCPDTGICPDGLHCLL